MREVLGATLFLAGVCDGRVVGYVIARHVADEAEILNLAVAPDARRRGIGRALAVGALSALRACGVATVYLEVRVSNQAARRLYAGLGFEPVASRPRYYRVPPEDALILRAALGARAGDA